MGQTRGTQIETVFWALAITWAPLHLPLLFLVGWTPVQFISPSDITQDKRGKEINREHLRDMHQVGQCWEEASNVIGWGWAGCMWNFVVEATKSLSQSTKDIIQ